MNRELKEALGAISAPFGLKPDFHMHGIHSTPFKRGPSKWLEIHDDANQYREFDYQVLDGNCFMPASPAGQHWIWYVLPEGLDAYTNAEGFVGYVIPQGIESIQRAANRDGLISYDERMALEQEKQDAACA
ncbi:MAG: hypothetical protein GY938_13265 [Ketobacter sp.]|nr:hypothetical protein [Ketobacter sp.]